MSQHTRHVAPDDQFSISHHGRATLETILAALGRDDKLRLAFLRRRWQGLSD